MSNEESASVTTGVASKRQRYVLILAERAKEEGVTVAELRDGALHHGRVSGALSTLHKSGRLSRLAETRNRCKVYVLPQHVSGRQTEPYGVAHRADKETLAAAAVVEARLRRDEDHEALFDIDLSDDPNRGALWRLVHYAKGEV